ncbi:M3 family metallopeptidase [Alloprevotella tannerae]|uniref:M3 family metallopeptidase n=1 Tax=Alloprevotella tannerae TaxID=76122 RepID=UPI0028ED6943|nr:M3 family metallopeptidase [Alloprevotella tannerae]
MIQRQNPFFGAYQTPHETIPFDRITLQDIEEAIDKGIKEEDEEIAAIVNNKEQPDFANTIAALDTTGTLLGKATSVLFNLSSAETNDELDALVQKYAPILTQHETAITLNEGLYKRIKAVYDAKPTLNDEEQMLLEKTFEGFERSGATLDEAGKEQLRKLSTGLSQLTVQFSQNHLKETNAFTLHLTKEEQLKGLPESQVEQAAQTAKEQQTEGWIITLKAPSYIPFMTYADDRELRKQLYMAYNTQCTHDNAHNNFEIVKRIVNLRREVAQLLGYASYADFALKNRMAEKPEHVYQLLNDLIKHYKAPAEKELKAISALSDEELKPWDFAYYSQKLKKKEFDLDAEMLRPYFELSQVKKGIFGLAERLYGITFKQNPDIPVYHPDVEAFEVIDENGDFLAVLYCDFHPRKGKQSGAWMTNYKEESEREGRPFVAIVMNLTKPTAEKPALLTLGEVETFLHEFGHALHGIFAKTRYAALSGTSVYWDFVELPSQFMENYAVEKEFLSTFAKHYKTGEPIPDELLAKIRKSRNFNVAYACMRQVSFGLLDMAYYTQTEPFTEDVRDFEQKAWAPAQLMKQEPETCMSVQFGHIMSGGYAAGYYSYKWAEVLDADAFSLFQETGIFNRETARRFRTNILEKGGTVHPLKLYTAFRGKAPSINALLIRNGLPTPNA